MSRAQICGREGAIIESHAELLAALKDVIDDDPCHLDHTGFCQSHCCGAPCATAHAHAVIAKAERLS